MTRGRPVGSPHKAPGTFERPPFELRESHKRDPEEATRQVFAKGKNPGIALEQHRHDVGVNDGASMRYAGSLGAPGAEHSRKLLRRFVFRRRVSHQRFEIRNRGDVLLRRQFLERSGSVRRQRFRVVGSALFHRSTIAGIASSRMPARHIARTIRLKLCAGREAGSLRGKFQ